MCDHDRFEVEADVMKSLDGNQHALTLQVKCAECHTPFVFAHGVTFGENKACIRLDIKPYNGQMHPPWAEMLDVNDFALALNKHAGRG